MRQIWAVQGLSYMGDLMFCQKNSAQVLMHDWVCCHDEAANHQLPIAVAFWIICIVSIEECSRLMQNLVPWNFWLFPKLKSPLKRERFQIADEIQENTTGSWWWLGELCEVPTLKGTEASSSYVQCFLYLKGFLEALTSVLTYLFMRIFSGYSEQSMYA